MLSFFRPSPFLSQQQSVAPQNLEGSTTVYSLTEVEELFVIGLVYEFPSIYLVDEMVYEIDTVLNIKISLSTVCRLVKRYGITRKKVRQVGCKVVMYIAHISNFMPICFCG